MVTMISVMIPLDTIKYINCFSWKKFCLLSSKLLSIFSNFVFNSVNFAQCCSNTFSNVLLLFVSVFRFRKSVIPSSTRTFLYWIYVDYPI